MFCLPCLIRRRGIWVHRCLLETFLHTNNSFVTLTIDDEHLPKDCSLSKRVVQKWLKRLRKRFGDQIRYYGCGEYGGKLFGSMDSTRMVNPHYHFILFGYPPCINPPPAGVKRIVACQCDPCVGIQKTWKYGFSDLRFAERKSIQYVAGYVTKKLTRKGHKGLYGLPPEFALMSRKPGIGADAMRVVNDSLTTDQGARELLAVGDVPSVLAHGKKLFPVGRYLKTKIREFYGFPVRRTLRGTKNNTPDGVVLRRSQELCALQVDYEADPKNQKGWFEHQKEQNVQKCLNIETKHEIFSKKGQL